MLRWFTHSLPLFTFDVRLAFSSLSLLSCLTIWLTCCSLYFWQESWVMYSLLLLYFFLYHTLMYTCYTLPEFKSFFSLLRGVHHSTPPSDPKAYCTSSLHLWQLFKTGLQFLYTSVWKMAWVIRDNHDLILIEGKEGENLNCPVAFLSSPVQSCLEGIFITFVSILVSILLDTPPWSVFSPSSSFFLSSLWSWVW